LTPEQIDRIMKGIIKITLVINPITIIIGENKRIIKNSSLTSLLLISLGVLGI